MSFIPPTDDRFKQLTHWLASLATPPLRLDSLRPASADASFRRYFRADADDGATYIVMDAPPPQEDVLPFIHVAQLFGATGVSVPHILAQDVARGFLLLSDLGPTTYLNQLNHDHRASAVHGRDRCAGPAASPQQAGSAAGVWTAPSSHASWRCFRSGTSASTWA